jgi:hypothetical protein
MGIERGNNGGIDIPSTPRERLEWVHNRINEQIAVLERLMKARAELSPYSLPRVVAALEYLKAASTAAKDAFQLEEKK